jgi:hypothetical protein
MTFSLLIGVVAVVGITAVYFVWGRKSSDSKPSDKA